MTLIRLDSGRIRILSDSILFDSTFIQFDVYLIQHLFDSTFIRFDCYLTQLLFDLTFIQLTIYSTMPNWARLLFDSTVI